MRLQEIRHPSTNTTRFAPSMDEARKVRQSLVGEFKFRKMDVSIEDAEVPTDKAGLIAFLNKLAKTLDA
jgi:hypothetical protein